MRDPAADGGAEARGSAADESTTGATDTDAATPDALSTDGSASDTTGTGAVSTDPTGTEALLEVTDLDAGYGDLQILESVDLTVGAGEYVTIVGPNGAGKSTVMKTVFGLTTFVGGSIRFAGEEISGLPPEDVIRRGVGYVPQSANVFPSLSVRENLEMGAYVLDSVPEGRIEAVYDRFPILRERSGQSVGTLSGGQQQMVAMGRALMLDPDLLLLDEPSAGLAPELVEETFDRVDAINDGGTAVVLVEQNAVEALERCDRGYVLVQGQNRYEDTGEALLANDQVRADFLGG